MADNDNSVRDRSSDKLLNRRSMLKATGASAAAATGLAATSGSASAQLFGPDVEVIDVSGGLFGGEFPVVDELFVFAHGWFGDTTVSSQASDVAGSLVDGGYEADANVAIEWDATTINFLGATAETADVGETIADMAEDFYDADGGNIRLAGHSLGGRVVLETVNALSDGYEIDTVAPLGAAADGDMVCDGGFGGDWYDGIANNAGEVRNYHSGNDSIVGAAYGGIGGAALGNDGSGGCGTPDKSADVDVTDSVSSHMGFLGDSEVDADLADAIQGGDSGPLDVDEDDDLGDIDDDELDDIEADLGDYDEDLDDVEDELGDVGEDLGWGDEDEGPDAATEDDAFGWF